jgi:hypothetical protein
VSSPRPGTVLVLYHRPSQWWFKDAATVREHIHAFDKHSRHRVFEVNVDHGFPPALDGVEPGAILLHYSLFGSGNYMLDDSARAYLRRSRAFKVAFFQDEFYFCQKRFSFVKDHGIDLVYTHVSPRFIPQVWGRYAPGTRAEFNLPGYVDEEMLSAARRFARPDAERDLDVGYRGRPLPPHMGAGSQEKRVIGERFAELAQRTPLRTDIATSEESRLYGDAWYRFLGRSRATLGVESGVSFMDLEDECHAEYIRLGARGHEPLLTELQRGALGRWDGNIPYRTIGPRHFEAAAFRICQVLYEGSYSGAMQPWVHYVPLKKDFSNFDEVVATLRDADARKRITTRAYDDLIASGRYSYASFVAGVDAELAAAGLSTEAAPADVGALRSALRQGALRRRARAELRRPIRALRYAIWRVIAPISLRVRRALGLRLPTM